MEEGDVMATAVDCLSPIRLVPGPMGRAGAGGADGLDGTTSFTTLTAAFTVPAIAASANATVLSSDWAIIGQTLHLQSAGEFVVTAIPDATTITLSNPASQTNNVAAGTIIPIASKLGPSGVIGPAGSNGAAGVGITVAAQGDIQTHDGTNPANQNIGTNDQTLHADSTSATGMDWRAIDLTGAATDLTGVLPIASGGTAGATAAAAAAALAVLPTAGGTMTGPILTSGTTPANKLIETDAALDEKRWETRAESADLKMQVVNDAESIRTDFLTVARTTTVVDLITLAATQLSLANSILAGNTYIPTGTVAMVNGDNPNFAIGTGTFFRITGPTGVFAISGIAGGVVNGVGRLIILHNTVAFALTFTHDATSSAANRIFTSTGADVVTTTNGYAILLYDVTETRWLLLAVAV